MYTNLSLAISTTPNEAREGEGTYDVRVEMTNEYHPR
jgi:hypothetical protein